jgi:hypothetical protein
MNLEYNIDMKEYYYKAKYTLKIIMTKMGLVEAY